MKWIVDHEIYGKVLFDTGTQKYTYLDYDSIRFFTYNGKSARFFDTILSMIDVNVELAVVPVVCSDAKQIKARTMINVIDIANNNYTFFNVERINEKWVKNNIANVVKSKCYFLMLLKNKDAMNDVILVSTLEIKEGMHTHPFSNQPLQ